MLKSPLAYDDSYQQALIFHLLPSQHYNEVQMNNSKGQDAKNLICTHS